MAYEFDVELLLQPISAELPSGPSLRYEGTYDRIREARREDDATLSQGVWTSEKKKADWNLVQELCLTTLERESKDLQIAAWLLESWLHIHGFAGAREGLRMMHALAESFWDSIHPGVENGDWEFRAAPLDWINEKLSVTLNLIPITAPGSEEVPAYCWADWENARRAEEPPGGRSSKTTKGPNRITPVVFHQSATLTPTSALKILFDEIRESMDACRTLEAFFDERCGRQAPSLHRFWAVLNAICEFLLSLLSLREVNYSRDFLESPSSEAHPAGQSVALTAAATESTGPIRSRADAYQRLAEAAEYLARAEPHSPAPYLVKRAILWGNMTLDELLPELVRNDQERSEIFRLLQIPSGQSVKSPSR